MCITLVKYFLRTLEKWRCFHIQILFYSYYTFSQNNLQWRIVLVIIQKEFFQVHQDVKKSSSTSKIELKIMTQSF